MATHPTLPKHDFIDDINLKSGISLFKSHTDGRVVAAKHIDYADWQDAVENGRPSFECEILERIGSHPNIVEVVNIAWSYPFQGHKAIIMEFCKGSTCGALREHCQNRKRLVPPILIWHCLLSVVSASKHLTGLGVVNGDLYNLANTMFCPNEADPRLYPQFKLIDFGSATRFSDWFSFDGKEMPTLEYTLQRDVISFASAISSFFKCNHLPNDLKRWLTRLRKGDFTWTVLSEDFVPYAEEQVRADPHMPDWLITYFQGTVEHANTLSNN